MLTCQVCHGNDADRPCAYPGDGCVGCLRDARLSVRAHPKDHIEFMRGLSLDHDPDGWPAVRMRDITRMCDIAESIVPGLDRLQERLQAGAMIRQEEGVWQLRTANGEVIATGNSLRSLIVDLVWTHC